MGFNFFGKKSNIIVESHEPVHSVIVHEKWQNEENARREEKSEEGDMAKDLMALIGQAIDEWANQYHMQNLPNHIVFEQALAIMNAWDAAIRDEK